MKKLTCLLLVCLAAASRLAAFSAEGHKTVADIAESLLTPAAKHAVAEILGSETMAEAAVWPDEIKPPFGRLAKMPEAHAFNHDHPGNKTWHYVNFPVGSTSYSLSSPYAKNTDIVHVINGCIKVLEGGTYENLTPKEALRWIIHLTGDIHQPLHTVTGYYDLSDLDHPKLDTTIASVDADTSDSGGNALDYGPGELHAYFDKVIVDAIFTTNDPAALANHVMQGVSPAAFKTAGARSKWVLKWATDSMKQAAPIYKDLDFGAAKLDGHGDLKVMAVSLKPDSASFKAKYVTVMTEQLRKAGVHLADLLNSIDWENQP